jgi:hypothetical protein
MAGKALIVVQSQFVSRGGKVEPGPAKLLLVRPGAPLWTTEVIEDPESNVFHKGIFWRNGVLTIGAMGAKLKHWTRGNKGWQGRQLWAASFGGKFDRLRDIEQGDVDRDGHPELVIATHDQGVVAVGHEAGGKWRFEQLGREPNTFVHEIEVGDTEGDGKLEFYCAASDRNRASQVSQPGGVYRYDWNGTTFVRSTVGTWSDTHPKEILLADVNADGKDELYVVLEALTSRQEKRLIMERPVQILRASQSTAGHWTTEVVAEIQDLQTRFLVPGDVDGNGKVELVAAAMRSGLWLLRKNKAGRFDKTLIDGDSAGYEHATHVADLDGDGRAEIYVAADRQKQIRQYVWEGKTFRRTKILEMPGHQITWNIQHGPL